MAKKKTLRHALKGKVKAERIPRGFDIIGDIAIIEIPKELLKKEKLIGEEILKLHKNVKTVVRKVGGHKGQLRVQKNKVIAGIRKKETIYTEHGCRFKLNIDKTYFSVRLANERKRIFGMIKKGENVLVMFSGCGPYPIVFSKNSPAKNIIGVELNKDAHKYGLENLKLNKIENVELINGDVAKKVPKIKGKFDRILMPLPRGGEDFLGVALGKVKKKGVIHFYAFLKEDKFDEAKEMIKKACGKAKKKYRILKLVKSGQQGPGIYRICVDFKVL